MNSLFAVVSFCLMGLSLLLFLFRTLGPGNRPFVPVHKKGRNCVALSLIAVGVPLLASGLKIEVFLWLGLIILECSCILTLMPE